MQKNCADQAVPFSPQEQMEPGTLFLLENNNGAMGPAKSPYVAVLSCPQCGALGLITNTQYACLESMICGSDNCSSEYHLNDEEIESRKPHECGSEAQTGVRQSRAPVFIVLVTEEKAFFIAMYGNEANALAWFLQPI